MLGGFRGYLSSPSGAEVQSLAAGQRDAQRFLGLVGNALHRCLVIRQAACVTSWPFPESTASGGSCLAWTSPAPRPRPWRRPSASGRAVSPSVTCRPWFPPFGRRHGNASVKWRSGSSAIVVLTLERAALNEA